MHWIPSLTAWPFAAAGLLCAAGPIVIHLLHRRRFRVVPWAATRFLRESLRRNRRIMQLRELVLLVLRTLAVLFVGLALAQPYWSSLAERFESNAPLHAVLVVDNSLSMGYETLEGSLLDQAKQRAGEFIDRLPPGSIVSLIPLCGSRHDVSPDPYVDLQDARDALETIETVDRSASIQRAADEARRACQTAPQLAKRVVILSDQQRINWQDVGREWSADLSSVQLVDLSPSNWTNTCITSIEVQDGLADMQTPTTFIVQLRRFGGAEVRDVQVTLEVDGVEVASKPVSLEPGTASREVAFQFTFRGYQPEEGRPLLIPVTASISPDRLPADDHRHVVVPVVASIPVLFVDQYGASGEDLLSNAVGETKHLRSLLAPGSSRDESARNLVAIQHRKVSDFDPDDPGLLADARLVVVAGARDPGALVPWLRQYVEQGGQLVIAAGGDFDYRMWNAAAWLDGAGILPAPLVGETGSLATDLTHLSSPLVLSYGSMRAHDYFRLAGMSDEELQDLYAEPLFFKAIEVDVSPRTMDQLVESEAARIEQWWNSRPGEQQGVPSSSLRPPGGLAEPSADWLSWSNDSPNAVADNPPEDPAEHRQWIRDRAERTRPLVRACFERENGPAFLVERQVGNGTVLFVTSGLLSRWTTLPHTNAFILFDRILRSRMRATLPNYNFAVLDRIFLDLPERVQPRTVRLERPGYTAGSESLDVGFVGRRHRGVSIEKPYQRGTYRLVASMADVSDTNEETSREGHTQWEVALAVNGDSAESDLVPVDRRVFDDPGNTPGVRWVRGSDQIELAGGAILGHDCWRWLVLAVMLLLAAELLLLSSAGQERRGTRRSSSVPQGSSRAQESFDPL